MTAPRRAAHDDLTAFYEAGYTQDDPERAAMLGRWRALGAQSKAAHVVALCRRAGARPRTAVEIGCGDGALLSALVQAGLAARYDGFELSAPAAEIARARGIPGIGRIEAYDGLRIPAGDGAYDLAILSHVLEHVPEPQALLEEAARVGGQVIVEVPLEDNRSGRRPEKVAGSRAIGHIQAFDRAGVEALAARAGLRVVEALTDPLPRSHHAFFAPDRGARARASLKWAVRAAVWRAAPRRAERLFTVHYACLLRPDGSSRGPGASAAM